MLEIKCPYCGKRSQNEFSYGGDGTIKRPALGEEILLLKIGMTLFILEIIQEVNTELWQHVSGCRQWFKVLRDTATHEIFSTCKMNEDLNE